MNACTVVSAFQLLATALTFILAVLWLEMFWVRIAEELHHGDVTSALRKRSWLNALVALGVGGAAILLVLWVSSCTNAGF
jgi:multisubunit Na+/H+ antiporter MnhB subunit